MTGAMHEQEHLATAHGGAGRPARAPGARGGDEQRQHGGQQGADQPDPYAEQAPDHGGEHQHRHHDHGDEQHSTENACSTTNDDIRYADD